MSGELFLSLFTAAGLGSILTVALQSWLESRGRKRERSFNEKKEAYVGLLDALRKVNIDATLANRKECGYWLARMRLIAPLPLVSAADAFASLSDGKTDAKSEFDALVQGMRSDLQGSM
ncbi:MAG: hypothetical protein ABL957_14955 [Parvularculaceae bacterium]